MEGVAEIVEKKTYNIKPKMIPYVKPKDILKKCVSCGEIKGLADYDVTKKKNNFTYYCGNCKACRLIVLYKNRSKRNLLKDEKKKQIVYE